MIDHARFIVPEVEFAVGCQPGRRQVRGAGNDAFALAILVAEEIGFAVEEAVTVAAHFNLVRGEEVEQLLHDLIHL